MTEDRDPKPNDEIIFNGDRALILSTNGSGSTFHLKWKNGTTGYYESYGYGVEWHFLKSAKQTPRRGRR